MELLMTIFGVRAVFASRFGAGCMLAFFGLLFVVAVADSGFRLNLLNLVAFVACVCAARTFIPTKE